MSLARDFNPASHHGQHAHSPPGAVLNEVLPPLPGARNVSSALARLAAQLAALLLFATPILAGLLVTWLLEPRQHEAVGRWGHGQLGHVWLWAGAVPILALAGFALVDSTLAAGPWLDAWTRASVALVLLVWTGAGTVTVQWLRSHPRQPPGGRDAA